MGLARFEVTNEVKPEVEKLLARMQGIRSVEWVQTNGHTWTVDDEVRIQVVPDWYCTVEAAFFPDGSTNCTPIITTGPDGRVLTWNWDIEGVGHHRVDG